MGRSVAGGRVRGISVASTGGNVCRRVVSDVRESVGAVRSGTTVGGSIGRRHVTRLGRHLSTVGGLCAPVSVRGGGSVRSTVRLRGRCGRMFGSLTRIIGTRVGIRIGGGRLGLSSSGVGSHVACLGGFFSGDHGGVIGGTVSSLHGTCGRCKGSCIGSIVGSAGGNGGPGVSGVVQSTCTTLSLDSGNGRRLGAALRRLTRVTRVRGSIGGAPGRRRITPIGPSIGRIGRASMSSTDSSPSSAKNVTRQDRTIPDRPAGARRLRSRARRPVSRRPVDAPGPRIGGALPSSSFRHNRVNASLICRDVTSLRSSLKRRSADDSLLGTERSVVSGLDRTKFRRARTDSVIGGVVSNLANNDLCDSIRSSDAEHLLLGTACTAIANGRHGVRTIVGSFTGDISDRNGAENGVIGNGMCLDVNRLIRCVSDVAKGGVVGGCLFGRVGGCLCTDAGGRNGCHTASRSAVGGLGTERFIRCMSNVTGRHLRELRIRRAGGIGLGCVMRGRGIGTFASVGRNSCLRARCSDGLEHVGVFTGSAVVNCVKIPGVSGFNGCSVIGRN